MGRFAKLSRALTLGIIVVISPASCAAQDMTLLCKSWTFGYSVISDPAQNDAWVQKSQQVTIDQLVKQGFTADQIASVRSQLASQKKEAPPKDLRLSFKNDHSCAMSSPSAGMALAGTWVLKGSTLTVTWTVAGHTSDPAAFEIVSLSQSELVLKLHGETTTYVSTDK